MKEPREPDSQPCLQFFQIYVEPEKVSAYLSESNTDLSSHASANEAETIAVNEQESRRLHDQRTADVVFASAEPDHDYFERHPREGVVRKWWTEDETEYLFEFAVTRQALWELEFEEPVEVASEEEENESYSTSPTACHSPADDRGLGFPKIPQGTDGGDANIDGAEFTVDIPLHPLSKQSPCSDKTSPATNDVTSPHVTHQSGEANINRIVSLDEEEDASESVGDNELDVIYTLPLDEDELHILSTPSICGDIELEERLEGQIPLGELHGLSSQEYPVDPHSSESNWIEYTTPATNLSSSALSRTTTGRASETSVCSFDGDFSFSSDEGTDSSFSSSDVEEVATETREKRASALTWNPPSPHVPLPHSKRPIPHILRPTSCHPSIADLPPGTLPYIEIPPVSHLDGGRGREMTLSERRYRQFGICSLPSLYSGPMLLEVAVHQAFARSRVEEQQHVAMWLQAAREGMLVVGEGEEEEFREAWDGAIKIEEEIQNELEDYKRWAVSWYRGMMLRGARRRQERLEAWERKVEKELGSTDILHIV
ncbi:hypothetical protein BT69DRAFT_1291816 [Atractiella rhizophila]|nr:hypothetical protein BT69DRAFT_1291816 [Atractiella rhizophila]